MRIRNFPRYPLGPFPRNVDLTLAVLRGGWVSSQPDQKAAYPQLWQMAIDCLSAMPMSAASESSFSGMRRTITRSSSQLGGQVIEEGECLKDWQRRGYACQVDDGYDSDSSDDEDLPAPVAE